MFDPLSIQRLARQLSPDKHLHARVLARIRRTIEPAHLLDAVSTVEPSPALRSVLKQRVLQTIHQGSQELLPSLAGAVQVSPVSRLRIKEAVLRRLEVPHVRWMPSFLKWTAAFAAFLMGVQSLPLVFLAPVLQAETSVQIIASGEVSVTVGGIQNSVNVTSFLKGPAVIRTGNSQATVIFNDDGVVRLSANTTVRIHDIGDRPHFASQHPTLTLVKGQLWALGTIPTAFLPISIATSQGVASVNAGSLSVTDDGRNVTLAVYDRGASFRSTKKELFLVTGESLSARGGSIASSHVPASGFLQPWVSVNLDMDAAHRFQIGQLQKERREKMAGILPDSSFYLAKRLAEEVDVIFTLDKDSKVEKRVRQADTRLNEAIALLQKGQDEQAEKPLSEYKESLVAVAGSGDSIARFLIQKQIEDATSSIAVAVAEDDHFQPLQQTVADVSASMPESEGSNAVKQQMLITTLVDMNQSLLLSADPASVVQRYDAIRPQLQKILTDDGPQFLLLKKEVSSLLSSIAIKFDVAAAQSADVQIVAIRTELEPYLPTQEQPVGETDEEIEADVKQGFDSIFRLSLASSRYNETIRVMDGWRADQNRGKKLRLLHDMLPDGLAGYVRTEIREAGRALNADADFQL